MIILGFTDMAIDIHMNIIQEVSFGNVAFASYISRNQKNVNTRKLNFLLVMYRLITNMSKPERKRKINVTFLREYAEQKKGKCHATGYENHSIPLPWECENGHKWDYPWDYVRKGNWCPQCTGKRSRQKWSLEFAKKLGESKGLDCISKKFINCTTNMQWKCKKEGHESWIRPDNLHNQGCPQCSRNMVSAEVYVEIAEEKKGGLDVSTFKNSSSLARWWCEWGHTWWTKPYWIRIYGRWCPHCNKLSPLTIEEMQAIASSREGFCRSLIYVNILTKLEWECKNGHTWWATPTIIKRGSWCPNCKYKNEADCRTIIEGFTKLKFPKNRPKWLDKLELDGYCEKLGIAFEYQGQQHYKVIDHWHKEGKEDLKRQQERDIRKLRLCAQNNVRIIVIPYYETNRKEFIRRELIKMLLAIKRARARCAYEDITHVANQEAQQEIVPDGSPFDTTRFTIHDIYEPSMEIEDVAYECADIYL